MKYFKQTKGVNTTKVEISHDEALNVLLGSFRDNDMTRDMLTIPNRIECRYSTVYVEQPTEYGINIVLMAGLCNDIPDGVEYDDNGNRI